jgi:hypothetical protein
VFYVTLKRGKIFTETANLSAKEGIGDAEEGAIGHGPKGEKLLRGKGSGQIPS